MSETEYAVQNGPLSAGGAIHVRANFDPHAAPSPPWVNQTAKRSRWSLKHLLIAGAALLFAGQRLITATTTGPPASFWSRPMTHM